MQEPAWSTDNMSYNTIQTCISPVSPSQWAHYRLTINPAIADLPDVVYYRVTMENFDTNGFSLVQTQWNRQISTSPAPTDTNADSFRVDFTVQEIPEAATLALFLPGGG